MSNATVHREAGPVPRLHLRLHEAESNRRPPAEADMQAYFEVTPPSVHRMVLELEQRGLIRRTPGAARSIALLVRAEDLPILR